MVLPAAADDSGGIRTGAANNSKATPLRASGNQGVGFQATHSERMPRAVCTLTK